jgi:hypothetical protein
MIEILKNKYNNCVIFNKIVQSELSYYFNKRNYISVIFFYLLAYISLFIADVYYADDHIRRYSGKIALAGAGRFVNEIVIIVWNFSRSILDSSPLFQIYAIFTLATLSLSLLAIFKIKTGVIQLLASTFTGIFPLYYSNMLYKVDAPFMSLSILFAVIPFLFYQRPKMFYLASFLSSIITLSTYQISLSAYPIVFLFVLAGEFISDRKINIRLTVSAMLCFAAGILVYRLTLYKLVSITHVDNTIIPMNALLPGLLHNCTVHAMHVASLLGVTNIIVVGVIALLLLWQHARNAKINKLLATAIILATITIGFLMTSGISLVLLHAPLNSRYYLLVSFFVGILAILASQHANGIIKLTLVLAAFYFVNLDNSIGNALKTKVEYNRMIIGHFVYDFKNIIGNKDYIIEETPGQTSSMPSIFNIHNNPEGLSSSHSRLVESIINDMDYGMDQYMGVLLPLAKGKHHPKPGNSAYHIILSKSDYDIYFNNGDSYKAVFKFLGRP